MHFYVCKLLGSVHTVSIFHKPLKPLISFLHYNGSQLSIQDFTVGLHTYIGYLLCTDAIGWVREWHPARKKL